MQFSKFTSSLSSLSGLFLLVASLSNFYLAYRASRHIDQRLVVVTNRIDVVSSSVPTNLPQAVTNTFPDLIVPPTVEPLPEPPKEVAQWEYQYFVIGRRIGCCAFGRYYYDGSPCSYGRIGAIYPDRILLSNGDWISNRLVSSLASNLPKERIVPNVK